MITHDDIAAEAMSWRGTPFKWQASLKLVGCDCKGLIVGVGRELGLSQAMSKWALINNYTKVDRRLMEGIEDQFEPVPRETMRPGHLLVHLIKRRPMHLSIVGDGRMIHSYTDMVVAATNLQEGLKLWPLHSVWAWRGVE